MLEIPNCRFIHPYSIEMTIDVPANDGLERDGITYPIIPARVTQYHSATLSNATTLTLPWIPHVPQNLEIYVDGLRLVNLTNDFGLQYDNYKLNGDVITFENPVTGIVDIISDNRTVPYQVRDVYYVSFDNVQGTETVSPSPDQTYAGTWCEPMIITQPQFGYARLSDDRTRIVYVPNQSFIGEDAFSYILVSQRGQTSTPKCVYINVIPPPEAPPEGENI